MGFLFRGFRFQGFYGGLRLKSFICCSLMLLSGLDFYFTKLNEKFTSIIIKSHLCSTNNLNPSVKLFSIAYIIGAIYLAVFRFKSILGFFSNNSSNFRS